MLSLLFVTTAWAQTLFVQGPTTPDIDYQRHLQTHKNSLSVVEYKSAPHKPLQDKLLQDFKSAQYQFLSGTRSATLRAFQEVIASQWVADWKQEEKDIIVYSLLRLAQLNDQEKGDIQLIKRALVFDPTHEIDKRLFPPPLVKKFNETKVSLQKKLWELPKNSQEFDQISINGKPLQQRASFTEHFSGKVRIHFISNRYQSVAVVTELKDLSKRKIQLKPIYSGDCFQPKFTETFPPSLEVKLFDAHCALKQQKVTDSSNSKALHLPPMAHNSQVNTKKKSHPSFMKNKWIWLGASVLLGGLVYQQSQGRRRHLQRTATPAQPAGPPVFSNQ